MGDFQPQFVLLSVLLLYYSIGQIIKSTFVSLSVSIPMTIIFIRFWRDFAQWFVSLKVRSSLFGVKIQSPFPSGSIYMKFLPVVAEEN